MLAEQVGAVKLIRAYGEEEHQVRKLTDQLTRYRKKVLRTQRYSSMTAPMSEIFGGLLIILIIAAATQPTLVGGVPLAPEAAIAFLVASLQLMSPIKSISQYPASMAIALASAERVYGLLDEPATDVDAPGDVPAVFARDVDGRTKKDARVQALEAELKAAMKQTGCQHLSVTAQDELVKDIPELTVNGLPIMFAVRLPGCVSV